MNQSFARSKCWIVLKAWMLLYDSNIGRSFDSSLGSNQRLSPTLCHSRWAALESAQRGFIANTTLLSFDGVLDISRIPTDLLHRIPPLESRWTSFQEDSPTNHLPSPNPEDQQWSRPTKRSQIWTESIRFCHSTWMLWSAGSRLTWEQRENLSLPRRLEETGAGTNVGVRSYSVALPAPSLPRLQPCYALLLGSAQFLPLWPSRGGCDSWFGLIPMRTTAFQLSPHARTSQKAEVQRQPAKASRPASLPKSPSSILRMRRHWQDWSRLCGFYTPQTAKANRKIHSQELRSDNKSTLKQKRSEQTTISKCPAKLGRL